MIKQNIHKYNLEKPIQTAAIWTIYVCGKYIF